MEDFLIDSTKIMYHPRRVVELLDGRNDWQKAKDIFPLYIEVSPMGACNHRCTFCAVDYIGYKSIQLSLERVSILAEAMGRKGVRSVMFAGEGEPLLHREINEMVMCMDFSGVDVAFTTNGVLLDKLIELERCTWIKVSVNAGTRETYAKVHRTKEKDWDRVWDNIRAAVKRKGKCTIGVQMVLLPENEHEAPALQALCDEAGVDYLVLKPYSQHKFSITRQYEGFAPSVPTSSPGVVIREESIKTKEIPYTKCYATPFLWAYVMATGDVYSCSAYLLDDRFNLGNINTQSFEEIWQGEKRRHNFNLVRNELSIHECRVNCRMDKANRYLDELEKGIAHLNFI